MNTTLTNLMKKTIRDLELYETGNLYNSIIVNTYFKNGDLYIDVKALDYIKYLTKENNISKVFSDQQGFSKEISAIMQLEINKQINLFLKENKKVDFNPKIIVLYNGK